MPTPARQLLAEDANSILSTLSSHSVLRTLGLLDPEHQRLLSLKLKRETGSQAGFLHIILRDGILAASLDALADATDLLKNRANIELLGMSPATYFRLRNTPEKVLTQVQTAQTYQFAEVITLANDVLGSREAADRWMEAPNRFLDNERPIDLLRTPPGLARVKTYLVQIDSGVYV